MSPENAADIFVRENNAISNLSISERTIVELLKGFNASYGVNLHESRITSSCFLSTISLLNDTLNSLETTQKCLLEDTVGESGLVATGVLDGVEMIGGLAVVT